MWIISSIIVKLESLVESSDIFAAEKDFKKLLGDYKAVGPFNLLEEKEEEEFDELNIRFELSKARFTEAQEWLRR